MSIEARVHAEIVYHDKGTATFTIGSVTDHIYATPLKAGILTAVATTVVTAVPITGSVTTLGIKNTGSTPILIGGSLAIASGRLAILPVTATVTVSVGTTSAISSYTAVWLG
jgi:hypothetical protein